MSGVNFRWLYYLYFCFGKFLYGSWMRLMLLPYPLRVILAFILRFLCHLPRFARIAGRNLSGRMIWNVLKNLALSL